MTKARVNDKLAFAGIKGDARDEWWITPLRCFNNRPPESWWTDDPLYVYLAAEAGITVDTEHPQWINDKGAFLLGGATCNCLTCSGAATEAGDFTDTIPDEVVADDADSRVREVVSSGELDAVRQEVAPSGQDRVQGLPSWWT